jgi:type IV pilus assembly protein PilB
VGQRLVRRLHRTSRQSFVPTPEEQQEIIKLFGLRKDQDFRIIHEFEKQAAAEGLGGDTPLSTTETGIRQLWRNNKDFNDDEAQEGYKGRLGIYEVLTNSTEVKNLIMTRGSSDQIQAQSIKEGMMTMQIDGLIKALRGETTIEEVLRVSRD